MSRDKREPVAHSLDGPTPNFWEISSRQPAQPATPDVARTAPAQPDRPAEAEPRYLNTLMLGSLAVGFGVASGAEIGMGMPEVVVDGTLVTAAAVALTALASLAVEHVRSRRSGNNS